MKPVAIFRHAPAEGPGYFATFLERHSLPWREICLDHGDKVPDAPQDWSGLVFMGGPMSVNDDIAWIAHELSLIRRAIDEGVPVLGHCLGGQLMAKALGGAVSRNAVKEIGWGRVRVTDAPDTKLWLGDTREFLSFHWHGETFAIPDGCARLLESDWCANQAFARGKHLALQCHVEMTAAMIEQWCASGEREIARSDSPAVQTREQMMADVEQKLAGLHEVADRLYTRWIAGLED